MSRLSKAPSSTSTQVSFVLHNIKGPHFKEQAAIVSINGYHFHFHPRTKKKNARFYDTGYTLFIAPKEEIRIAVGIYTPDGKGTGFLHCFVRHVIPEPLEPMRQEITMRPPGDIYTILFSIYVAPSVKCSSGATSRASSKASSKTAQTMKPKSKNYPPPRAPSRQALTRIDRPISNNALSSDST